VQFLNGLVTWSASASGKAAGGGVAWFAHIGGFLVGMALLYALHPRRSRRAGHVDPGKFCLRGDFRYTFSMLGDPSEGPQAAPEAIPGPGIAVESIE
jgi:hypothetical protein